MTDPTPAGTAPRRRFRALWLAPVLALIALLAWAFASPIGAGPDDDYHLVSTWCAAGNETACQPGATATTRVISTSLRDIACYAQHEERSAACQGEIFDAAPSWETDRGNFAGEYPPVYYGVMQFLAIDDIQVGALLMRALTAVLFVALATALAVLLAPGRRRTLLWGWLVTLVPLGVFIIPSNNPSGWAVMGVGTAFLALLGWFESAGRRRWALGALYLLGIVIAAGSRGDAGVYAVGASVTAALLTSEWTRDWRLRAVLPIIGIAIAVVFFVSAGQSGVAATGFTSGGGGASLTVGADGEAEAVPLAGFGLAAYNLLMLPFLWTGVWGTWGLGWLDTRLPSIVPWAATAAFIVVGFAGLGRLAWRKAIAVSGVLLVLIALPLYVLTAGGDKVGENLQPRYLLPLLVLFAMVLLSEVPRRAPLAFTRIQTFTILGALAIANLVALQVNLRRYVTGADVQGPNLDAGAEWWWPGLPFGPNAVWLVGVLAFAGLLAVLWPELRRPALRSPETLR